METEDSEVVETLLKSDLDANAKTVNGYTGFTMACHNGQSAVVHLLLKSDTVDFHATNCFGQNCIQMAKMNRHKLVDKLLIASGKF